MYFAHDLILWLMLATLPLLGVFLAWAWRRKQRLMTQFIHSRLLPLLTVRRSPRRELFRLALLLLALAGLFLALARPQWGFSWEEAHQRGLDIVVAIDTSRSMLAEDVRPNRLARAKLAALDLLRLARTDRLGLVAFAGTAYLQCPLTLDDEAFRQTVGALDTTIIPQGGTALTAAIETALAAFKDENNFKILVLISDGEDHDSGAAAAAERAAKSGLRIFTLGIGTANGELLRVLDNQGVPSYLKDAQGNVVKSRLNEPLLRQLATATGGLYLPLQAADAVDTLYAMGLAPLPKAELSARLLRQYRERYYWPLALGLLLLLLEAVLPHPQDRRRRPSEVTTRHSTRAAASVTAALLILWPSTVIATSAEQALKDYQSGRFKDAAREYRQLLEKDANDPRLHYNAGTAAYRAGEFDAAARALTNALTAPDLSLQQRSFYNLGNTLFQAGQQNPAGPDKLRHWEAALRSFDAALQLNPQDADARNNLEFVRLKLEELKRQQEQQQQEQPQDNTQPPSDQNRQNPNDSQDPNQQNQPNQDGQQPQPSPPEQSPPSSQPKPESSSQNTPQSQPQHPTSSPQPTPQDVGAPPEQADTDEPDDEPQATPHLSGAMTREQAMQLLEASKAEERALPFGLLRTNALPARPFKDW